ncbi:enoyl-CoA hydratase/isomerase family protein, partial [Acinetobacter baumannii]
MRRKWCGGRCRANIALACDLVIAAKSANFVQAFCRLGLVPDS